jgi:hypothetical protein
MVPKKNPSQEEKNHGVTFQGLEVSLKNVMTSKGSVNYFQSISMRLGMKIVGSIAIC